jgi:hypothetical protein
VAWTKAASKAWSNGSATPPKKEKEVEFGEMGHTGGEQEQEQESDLVHRSTTRHRLAFSP